MDVLFAALMAAGEDARRVREVLEAVPHDRILLGAVLRRPVPLRCLEVMAATPPWSEDQRLMGSVVLSPRVSRALALKLVGSLFWRDLADVAASPRVTAAARVRAEALLLDYMADLRLGDRITLAKIATAPVLARLLEDTEPRVVEAGLINGRLREEDLAGALRKDTVTRALIEGIAASSRWRDRYALRLAIVLQPRSPLAVALAQMTALLPADLERVAADEGLRPLVQLAARRVATGRVNATTIHTPSTWPPSVKTCGGNGSCEAWTSTRWRRRRRSASGSSRPSSRTASTCFRAASSRGPSCASTGSTWGWTPSGWWRSSCSPVAAIPSRPHEEQPRPPRALPPLVDGRGRRCCSLIAVLG